MANITASNTVPPNDLSKNFTILKKCKNKFDCLVFEMFFINELRPSLNVQSDSIHAKVFNQFLLISNCFLCVLSIAVLLHHFYIFHTS